MVAEVFSAMIQGIEGQIVKIQVDISNGLPNFNMIGYLSNEVKESKERVRTALNNIGVLLPPKRISVNFAPADFRKCGTSFDIGVAAAILLAMDFVPETYIKDTLFVGELSLNGQICPISGVLPIVVAASKRGIKRCIVAQENVAEAAFVEQMEVVGCRNLEELFFYLKHGYIINDDSGEILENSGNISEDSGKECTIQDVKKSQEISESTRSLNLLVKDILENADEDKISVTDFSEVKGQAMAKRAMEIAAAGYHNLMLGGPPGVGKSMLASCISGIMPQMTTEEMIDTVISLYLNNNISEKDLQNHIGDLQEELLLMHTAYKEEKEKHPVRLGTDTYETKSGTEAVSGLYEVYEKMLDDLSSLSGDKDKFTYTKLIYNNEIADKIAAYKAALICTSEEKETNNNGN